MMKKLFLLACIMLSVCANAVDVRCTYRPAAYAEARCEARYTPASYKKAAYQEANSDLKWQNSQLDRTVTSHPQTFRRQDMNMSAGGGAPLYASNTNRGGLGAAGGSKNNMSNLSASGSASQYTINFSGAAGSAMWAATRALDGKTETGQYCPGGCLEGECDCWTYYSDWDSVPVWVRFLFPWLKPFFKDGDYIHTGDDCGKGCSCCPTPVGDCIPAFVICLLAYGFVQYKKSRKEAEAVVL